MVRKQRTSYWGESKPTNITGGPHIVEIIMVDNGKSFLIVVTNHNNCYS